MGVNIVVYKVDPTTKDYKRIAPTEWDWGRHGYDSSFRFRTDCTYFDDGEVYSDTILKRPINLQAEAEMIRQTVPIPYQDRYIALIELLNTNPHYYVHWSW